MWNLCSKYPIYSCAPHFETRQEGSRSNKTNISPELEGLVVQEDFCASHTSGFVMRSSRQDNKLRLDEKSELTSNTQRRPWRHNQKKPEEKHEVMPEL